MGGTTSSIEKVKGSLDCSEEDVNKVTEEGWRLFEINNTSTGGSSMATVVIIIISAGTAALCGWVLMWLAFHYQTWRKASLEIRDEKLRVETEQLELRERRAASRKLRKEQLRKQEAETERWIAAEEAKTQSVRKERMGSEEGRPEEADNSIWMSSPRGISTPKPGHCSRCQGRHIESIV